VVVLQSKIWIASKGRMRGVIVNAGNANCATGNAGYASPVKTSGRKLHAACAAIRANCLSAPLASSAYRCRLKRFFARCPASFKTAPLGALVRGVIARICTTDTRQRLLRFLSDGGQARAPGGLRQGRGDDSSNMATTLAFVVTDAAISPALLQKLCEK